ncbi:MAG: GTP 3',8-cyclase MoaA [Candidatus Methanodesulfokora sp.]|jgi:cyclic pyranopterin phosphate synthase
MAVDRFGRPITSLRISVNYECNYRCFFCHNEGMEPANRLMSPEEIEKVVRVGAKYGVRKVKITGGEPLLRRDLEEIIRRIAGVDEIKEISLVTNGYMLKERAKGLRESGLDRVNVSIHSLNPEVYKRITGVDGLHRVIDGIEEAVKVGLKAKINRVILRGVNDGEEIDELIEFAKKTGTFLQIIELEGDYELMRRYHLPLNEIEEKLRKMGRLKGRKDLHDRPIYEVDGVDVELVKAYKNPDFCMHCTRMRVTPDGMFKPCLFRKDNLVPFLDRLREGKEIDSLFLLAVNRREPFYKG